MTNKEKYLVIKKSANILRFFKFSPTPTPTPAPRPSGGASNIIKQTGKGAKATVGEKVQQEGNLHNREKGKPNFITVDEKAVGDANATQPPPPVVPPTSTNKKPNLPPHLQ